MAWTAPRTWVVGEVLTASLLNTHLRDNINETAPAKVTTAGDTVYATGANAIARLAIGTANYIYRTNSTATAPEWGLLRQNMISTSTGSSTTGSAEFTQYDVTFNPYCFWPNISSGAPTNADLTGHTTDGGNADSPRVGWYSEGGGGAAGTFRWRYITS